MDRPPRNLRHNSHTSRILLKLFIVALMIIQTIIVAVGKNYYHRFLDLEAQDAQFGRDMETMRYELRLTQEKVISLEQELRIINAHLIDDAHSIAD